MSFGVFGGNAKSLFKELGIGSGYYRGLSNYLYWFGDSLLELENNGRQDHILKIKGPIEVLDFEAFIAV